jgi:hypothetical protein
MYVGAVRHPLHEIETLTHGYYSALHVHGIVELVPEMTHHFSTWLYATRGWSIQCGWAHAIRTHACARPQLDVFFDLVDEYRTLVPTSLLFAVSGPRSPGTRMPASAFHVGPPMRVEIIAYSPTQLHFLRLWWGRRALNDWILMTGDGSHAASLAFAKGKAAEKVAPSRIIWHKP